MQLENGAENTKCCGAKIPMYKIIRFGLVKQGQLFRFEGRWWMNEYNNEHFGVEVNTFGAPLDPHRRVSRYFDFNKHKVGVAI